MASLQPPRRSVCDLGRVRLFAWQQGYAAFSVSLSRVAAVQEYIRHQAEHHKKRNFEQEFFDLLRRSGVAFDSRDALR
jgi:hypothetical protein